MVKKNTTHETDFFVYGQKQHLQHQYSSNNNNNNNNNSNQKQHRLSIDETKKYQERKNHNQTSNQEYHPNTIMTTTLTGTAPLLLPLQMTLLVVIFLLLLQPFSIFQFYFVTAYTTIRHIHPDRKSVV